MMSSVSSILQVILINIVLSGDNALVVALAARRLPSHQRKLAMFWGIGLAVAFQLILTLLVSSLLIVPGLQLLGGILLAWIACRLLQEESEPDHLAEEAPVSFRKAVARIAMADLIMSLDNVLAIAGVRCSDASHLIFGLVVSVAILLAFSTAIMALINRYHWIAYAGTAILAFTAAGMISHDLATLGWFGFAEVGSVEPRPWVEWPFRVLFLCGALSSFRWWPALKAFQWSSLVPEPREQSVQEASVEVQAGS